jgi:Phosphoribosyl-AMP cyclohydrolase
LLPLQRPQQLRKDYTLHVIPVAVQNAITNEVILIAYTNKIAFDEAIRVKKSCFLEHIKKRNLV